MFCRSLFVLLYFFFWPLQVVCSSSIYGLSDFPFGIFKLFLQVLWTFSVSYTLRNDTDTDDELEMKEWRQWRARNEGMTTDLDLNCPIQIQITRLTRRVPLVKQELLTLPENMSSPPVFSGVRVARSLVFCVVFCRSLFVLLPFFYLAIVFCYSQS
jgi:hypothetical protein